MDESKGPGPFSSPQPACPYFQPAQADWLYPVSGYCRGLLMIPSIEEYRALCSTAQHATCLIYRGRHGEKEAEAAVRAACQSGGPFPRLNGLDKPQPDPTDHAPLCPAPGVLVAHSS